MRNAALADALQSRPLTAHDRDGLRQALNAEGLPTGDLAEEGIRLFAFECDGRLSGYGGLEVHGDAALLRSIVVDPGMRRERIGAGIVEALVRLAAREGATRAFILTTNAADYFGRLGFAAIDRSEAPDAILATRQAARLCPATAVLMAKTLAP